jgi:hypothetical protein
VAAVVAPRLSRWLLRHRRAARRRRCRRPRRDDHVHAAATDDDGAGRAIRSTDPDLVDEVEPSVVAVC